MSIARVQYCKERVQITHWSTGTGHGNMLSATSLVAFDSEVEVVFSLNVQKTFLPVTFDATGSLLIH